MASTSELSISPSADGLTVAVRAHTILTPKQSDTDTNPRKPRRPRERRADACREVLIVDVETRVDDAQALRFGNWQYCRLTAKGWSCVEEGLIYDDDLPTYEPEGFAAMRRFTEDRKSVV